MLPDIELYQLIYGRGASAYRVLYYLVDAEGSGKTDTVRVLHVRHGAQSRLNEDSEE